MNQTAFGSQKRGSLADEILYLLTVFEPGHVTIRSAAKNVFVPLRPGASHEIDRAPIVARSGRHREELTMNPTRTSVFLFATTMSIVTVLVSNGPGQELSSADPAETMAPEWPSAHVAPVPCVAIPPAIVFAAGPRGHRRGALLAPAVAVGPRAIYPGTLAPWGSLPAAFYAASYPLPLHDPPEPKWTPHAFGALRLPESMPVQPSVKSQRDEKAGSSDRFSGQDVTPAESLPEPIPAPHPMDVPTDDDTALQPKR